MISCFIILIQTLWTIRNTNFVILVATGNNPKLFENATTRTFKFLRLFSIKKQTVGIKISDSRECFNFVIT